MLKFKKLTQAQYNALVTKDANTWYITSDTLKVYVGSELLYSLELANKVDKTAMVALASNNTVQQVPTAKSVWDMLQEVISLVPPGGLKIPLSAALESSVKTLTLANQTPGACWYVEDMDVTAEGRSGIIWVGYVDPNNVASGKAWYSFIDQFNSMDTTTMEQLGSGAWAVRGTWLATQLSAFKGTLTKVDVGLGNVDNTSDANKPVSTAQQTALDGKAPANQSLAATTNTDTTTTTGAVASTTTATILQTIWNKIRSVVNAVDGKQATLASSTSNTISSNQVQRAALTGDVTASANSNATTIASGAVTNAKMANMTANAIKGNNTGAAAAPKDLTVAETKTLLALNNVDNTSDANKPVSTAQQTALDGKVDKVTSATGKLPKFNATGNLDNTGIEIDATGPVDTSTTKVPTNSVVKSYVDGKVVAVVDNLTSTSTTSALSAAQGKALNDRLAAIEAALNWTA